MDLQFQGKYVISGKIVCLTGLHVGGTTEGFEIGGMDNPVLKDALTDVPYIPGSSLKGKLRHLLEWSLGSNPFTGKPHHFTESEKKVSFEFCSCGRCEACVLFGTTPEDGVREMKEGEVVGFARVHRIQPAKKEEKPTFFRIAGPARLTVRDSFPTEKTVSDWDRLLGKNIYTEIKSENTIDRVTSEANPRSMERVPRGSEFEFEMLVDILHAEDKKLLPHLFSAMVLLENSYLGGSGTRGHGKIKFADLKISFRSIDYYLCKTETEEVLVTAKRDNLENPTRFTLSGKISEQIPYGESLVKRMGSKLEKVLS